MAELNIYELLKPKDGFNTTPAELQGLLKGYIEKISNSTRNTERYTALLKIIGTERGIQAQKDAYKKKRNTQIEELKNNYVFFMPFPGLIGSQCLKRLFNRYNLCMYDENATKKDGELIEVLSSLIRLVIKSYDHHKEPNLLNKVGNENHFDEITKELKEWNMLKRII